jgi:hypothetical protein
MLYLCRVKPYKPNIMDQKDKNNLIEFFVGLLSVICFISYFFGEKSDSVLIGSGLTIFWLLVSVAISNLVHNQYRNYPLSLDTQDYNFLSKRKNMKTFLRNIGIEIGLIYMFIIFLLIVIFEVSPYSVRFWDGFTMGLYTMGLIWFSMWTIKNYRKDYTKQMEDYLNDMKKEIKEANTLKISKIFEEIKSNYNNDNLDRVDQAMYGYYFRYKVKENLNLEVGCTTVNLFQKPQGFERFEVHQELISEMLDFFEGKGKGEVRPDINSSPGY